MIKVGIIGGAGYTAGELIRLLINHPETEIDFVFSTSNAGNKISKVHQDLVGSLDLEFTNTVNSDVDMLFLCLGHGNSVKFLSANTFSSNTKIIDLGNDFRLESDKVFKGKTFVYGLPELQTRIANFLPLSPWLYPEDHLTDISRLFLSTKFQPPQFRNAPH